MIPLWAILFFGTDILIVSALVCLLCSREVTLPRRLEGFFPLRGRWLYYFLVGAAVFAYLAFVPVFLFALIRMMKS